jgi:predicted AlkP superfamily pyrophosphatase or phosphodiesterase
MSIACLLLSAGHQYGPISSEMNRTLKQCDEYVAQLLNIIDHDDYLRTNLNVIITSDHGMHEVDRTHQIILEDLIDKSLFSAYGGHSFVNIFVYQGKRE